MSKKTDNPKKTIDDLKREAQKFEFNKIRKENLSSSQLDAFQERLYKIIDYAIGRHDWYDEQRTQFLQIGLALMAVGASLGAILVNFGKTWYISIYTLASVILVVLSIFLSGLIQLYLYNKGIQRDYPYRKIADIRSWYFKYNFPSGLEDNLSKDPSIAYNQVKEVKDNLEKFYGRILECANDKTNCIKEDLEQIFILLLLQRYRQQQVKSMSNALFNSMLAVTALLLMTLLAFILLESPYTNLGDKVLPNTTENKTFNSSNICSSQVINVFKENESKYLQDNFSKSTESLNANQKSNIKLLRVSS